MDDWDGILSPNNNSNNIMEKRTYLRNALKKGEPGVGMWLT